MREHNNNKTYLLLLALICIFFLVGVVGSGCKSLPSIRPEITLGKAQEDANLVKGEVEVEGDQTVNTEFDIEPEIVTGAGISIQKSEVKSGRDLTITSDPKVLDTIENVAEINVTAQKMNTKVWFIAVALGFLCLIILILGLLWGLRYMLQSDRINDARRGK